MRPTTNERLAGIERTLAQVAEDPGLSAASVDLIADVRRQLVRMLPVTAEQRDQFLRWDNDQMIELWMKVGDLDVIDADQTEQLVVNADMGDSNLTSENEGFRRLFEMLVDELPDNDAGRQAEVLIVKHLQARVDANPDLNKNPNRPWDA